MAGKEKGVIRTISKLHLQNAEEVTWNTTKGGANLYSGKDMELYGKKDGVLLGDYEPAENRATEDELGVAENIIVVGPQMYQHDGLVRGALFRWDAGPNAKFMFIHQAMRKVFLNPETKWTIVIYTAGYSDEQITAMELAIINKIGECHTVKVNVHDHVYNYINSMDFNDWSGAVSKLRKKNKIRRLHFYCHGLVFRLAMGITNRFETDGDLDITTTNISKIKEDAFEAGAKIYSFSCRTGLGNDKIDESLEYEEKVSTGYFSSTTIKKQYNLYSAQSLAQYIANYSNATVYAYLRRSEYSDTLNTDDELDFMDAYDAGMNEKKRERKNKKYDTLLVKKNIKETDTERYKTLDTERRNRTKIGKAVFDTKGAKYPVRAAPTPKGLPDSMMTFKKIK